MNLPRSFSRVVPWCPYSAAIFVTKHHYTRVKVVILSMRMEGHFGNGV